MATNSPAAIFWSRIVVSTFAVRPKERTGGCHLTISSSAVLMADRSSLSVRHWSLCRPSAQTPPVIASRVVALPATSKSTASLFWVGLASGWPSKFS